MKDLKHKPIVNFHKRFNRYLEKAPLEIKLAFREVLELFLDNPDHPQLRNHALKKEYSGYRSIDVTDDWRALFKIRKVNLKQLLLFIY